MYDIILAVHSIMRWIVLLLALLTVFRALAGWLGGKEWTNLDNRAGLFFTISFDIQLTLGLILIIVSPTVQRAFADPGGAMGDVVLRYWLAEHIPVMVIALALAHIGRSRSKRLAEAVARHRTAAIWFGLAILMVLATIPWPFLAYGRPLLPGLG
ncbi:MAG: hypothetical protein ACE5H9_13010 [Anaerolineae bacterium]